MPGGRLQITGSYTKTDAEKLAGQITGGTYDQKTAEDLAKKITG